MRYCMDAIEDSRFDKMGEKLGEKNNNIRNF